MEGFDVDETNISPDFVNIHLNAQTNIYLQKII
jgi:hypothetical protein